MRSISEGTGSGGKETNGAEAVTIFTDAQAAMARIASDEPGPAQQYARQARK